MNAVETVGRKGPLAAEPAHAGFDAAGSSPDWERVSGRISEFSGEFLDRDLELHFLESTRSARVRHFRLVAGTAAVFIVLGVVVDLLVVGNQAAIIGGLVAVRVVVAAAILWASMSSGHRTERQASLDRLAMLPLMALSVMTCGIVWAIRGELLLHALTALVLILVYYLFLPIRLVSCLAVSLVFSAGFIISVSTFLAIRPDEFIQVILYLTLVNILGAFASRERNRTLRREFFVLEGQRRIADNLRSEVAARTAAEEARIESESRFRALVELSPDAIMVHRDTRILYLNPVGARLLGATDQDRLVGRSMLDFVLKRYHQTIFERMERLERGTKVLPSIELQALTMDGREWPCEVLSGPILYGGEPAIQSVIRDITERTEMREELTRLATTDPLTGICNRRRFFERLELEWSRARRHSRPLSIMMFDLDHFKKINDTHGHSIGDRVLVELCSEANDVLRAEDVLARLGGEEFGVILPEIDRDTAGTVAQRLRQALAEVRIPAPEGVVQCTISIGVVQCRLVHESLDVALKRVDDALYSAKAQGRNQVVMG